MTIDFRDIENTPQLIKDFLNSSLTCFSSKPFRWEMAAQQAEIKAKKYTQKDRDIFLKVLKRQMSTFPLSPQQEKHLKILKENNSFTITTGHQLNLFTGPVFFIYKILQVIKTAEELNKKNLKMKFIPVFWMATEDHDFEEINHFYSEKSCFSLNEKSGGSVGRMKINDDRFIKKFEEEFKDKIFGNELILWMKEAYKKGNTLAQATRILVNRIFGSKGLLIIDGDDDELKSQMKDIFSQELQNFLLKKSIEKDLSCLVKQYRKVQVNPRNINLFYLSNTRNRIEIQGDKFSIIGKNELLSYEQLIENPGSLSPNAVMRPIYQEKVMPNILYIGGNSEIAYWLQLENFFKKVEVLFPLITPRNSILFTKEKTLNRIEKIGFQIKDFYHNFKSRMEEILLSDSVLREQIEENETQIRFAFKKLKNISQLTDISFKNMVEAEETRQLHSYKKFRKRLLRAEKLRQNEKYNQILSIYDELHPEGNWQERMYNFSVFYASGGFSWIESCYQKIDIEKSELIISVI